MEDNSITERKSWTTIFGVVFIALVGLLNFQIPHFLLEPTQLSGASRVVELVFVANLLTALVAALGMYRNQRWGWIVGRIVALIPALLYLIQETVGLAGLPHMWLEPSRIVSLMVEAIFVGVASRQLTIGARSGC